MTAEIRREPWGIDWSKMGLTDKGEELADELAKPGQQRERGDIGDMGAEDRILNRVEQEWKTEETPEHIEHLASGMFRVAIRLSGPYTLTGKDMVLKVPYAERRQSIAEIRVWNGASRDIRGLLCPIVQYDKEKAWLVMPQAMKRTQDDSVTRQDTFDMVDILKEIVGSKSDIRRENMGIYRDRIVIVDYGGINPRKI